MKFTGHNLNISYEARIGENVRIGDNTTIYAGVQIGDDSIICNDCVLGEPLAAYYSDVNYEHPPTVIGRGALIRSHAIIYAGSEIGEGFSTGHRITVRERTVIGSHCSVGTLVDIQGEAHIGNYCRLHSNVHLAQGSYLEDFVFLYPYSVMTNDPCPPSTDLRGARIGSFTQVGVHAVILPGVRVGANCLIAASSVVSKAVPDYSLVRGDPAHIEMDIREYVAMGKGKPYPWMNRFERGMPWEGVGFEEWMHRQTAETASR